LELKASGLGGNASFFNIVSKVLEIEVPCLLAMGKFIGAQMSEILLIVSSDPSKGKKRE
jgi:hypothetical protein